MSFSAATTTAEHTGHCLRGGLDEEEARLPEATGAAGVEVMLGLETEEDDRSAQTSHITCWQGSRTIGVKSEVDTWNKSRFFL